MLHLGILKTWNATTHKAGVQLASSLTTYLDNIAVATNIASSAMVVGNYVLVAIPGGNPRDACVVASWPAGSSGGGGGTFLSLTDTPSSYAGQKRCFPRVNFAENALEFIPGYEFGATMPLWQNEADFFHWTCTFTGSGYLSERDYGTLRLGTGSTASSTARGRGFGFGWVDYSVSDFQWFISMYARLSATTCQQWYKIDSDTSGDPTTYAIGFRADYDALKGIVHNGSSLTVVDLGVTLIQSEGYSLFLNFIHGNKIEWYVNGAKKGESTNVPTGLKNSNTWCVISAQNNASAANAQVHIHQHSFKEYL